MVDNSKYHKQYKIYRLFQFIKPFELYTTIMYLRTAQKQKKMCDNVNLMINKKGLSSNIDNLKVKDKDLQQPSSISNAINRYFYNVSTELASKLPKTDRHFSTYMRRKKINLPLCSSKRNQSTSTIRKYRH